MTYVCLPMAPQKKTGSKPGISEGSCLLRGWALRRNLTVDGLARKLGFVRKAEAERDAGDTHRYLKGLRRPDLEDGLQIATVTRIAPALFLVAPKATTLEWVETLERLAVIEREMLAQPGYTAKMVRP